MKMGKEILTFGNIEIEKNKFYRQKTPFCGGHGGGEGGYEYLKRFILVKKNYNCYIGHMYDNDKVKPLQIKEETASYIINY